MGKKKPVPIIKIVVVGSAGVGKYSLAHQFAKGWIAPRDGNDTSNTETVKQMEIQGIKYEVKVSVCKEVGQSEGQDLKGNDGVVLVYSVVDKKSLTYLKTVAFQKLHGSLGASDTTAAKDTNGTDVNQSSQQSEGNGKEIAETPTGQPGDVGLSVPVILVGNKVDDAKLSRAVESEEGEALSKELCCKGFFETAATCNANVPKAFERLLNEIVTQKTNGDDATGKPVKPTNACCVLM